LEGAIQREIRSASRLRKAFFSDEFKKNLEMFSPWRTSLGRLRALVGRARTDAQVRADLLSEPTVQRHVSRTLEELHRRTARSLERMSGRHRQTEETGIAFLETHGYEQAVSDLVGQTNEKARKDVESLLADLQEQHRVKDPLWGAVAGVASTMLLLDLVVPSVGTLSSLAASAALSALGLGGMITSDILRKLRTSRVRQLFEQGLSEILNDGAARMLKEDRLARLDLSELSSRLSRWSRKLSEVT
jgi:hypothetical protein